jgi:hypothetical protein
MILDMLSYVCVQKQVVAFNQIVPNTSGLPALVFPCGVPVITAAAA